MSIQFNIHECNYCGSEVFFYIAEDEIPIVNCPRCSRNPKFWVRLAETGNSNVADTFPDTEQELRGL